VCEVASRPHPTVRTGISAGSNRDGVTFVGDTVEIRRTTVPSRGTQRASQRSTQHEAMRALHDAHAAALWSFALRLTGGDRAEAEDVTQETLLRAWRSPNSPLFTSREQSSARSWLYTVARRIVIDEWRSRSARPETLMGELPERGVADRAEDIVVSQIMADALARLSGEHRAVLHEMFYRRSSVAEAAQKLGIAEGTVKSRTHYALKALRLVLAEMGIDGMEAMS